MSSSVDSGQLAVEHFQKGDYAAALEHARAVLGESDNNAIMWQICGLASMQLGQFQAGLAALEQTLRLSGDDAELLNNIGIASSISSVSLNVMSNIILGNLSGRTSLKSN